MKLIGHAEAFQRIKNFLSPEPKRQIFGLQAQEGLGRKVFVQELFEDVTGYSFTSSDFLLVEDGVDAIRAAIEWVHLSPTQAATKFLVILSDQLTQEAQQALLKLLEEPPQDLVVLVVGTLVNLLEAIHSRLTIIRLHHLSYQDCVTIWEGLGIEHSMFRTLGGLAPGQPGLALDRLTWNYPKLMGSWSKFLQGAPSAIALLHWAEQIPRSWSESQARDFWLWLMVQTIKAYKVEPVPFCKFAYQVAEALMYHPESSTRLLVPALWNTVIERL